MLHPRGALIEIAAFVGLVLGSGPGGRDRTKLLALREQPKAQLEIETVDITRADEVMALRTCLKGRTPEFLLVIAGVKNDDRETIADVSTEEFMRVMVTNALSPLRVIETLSDLVRTGGTFMRVSRAWRRSRTRTAGNRSATIRRPVGPR